MIAYAESSAVLAWLLGEVGAEPVREALAGAERVVASTLTVLECRRALSRARQDGRLKPADEAAARERLDRASAGWVLMEMAGPAVDRAARPFPAEPVRTLDALHLATALEMQESLGTLLMVSLDQRILANAGPLGMKALPV